MTNPDERELTTEERRAIESLKRLARRWPRTLTLASMSGDLCVIRTGDPRFTGDGSLDRQEAIVADIRGIPNTGGDW